MHTETLIYHDGPTACHGYLARAEGQRPRPLVVVCHAWSGLTDFEREKARALASLGYTALALDNYGEGKVGADAEEKRALMGPLMEDRAALQRRLLAGLEAGRAHPAADGERCAAVGYCFGGLCALDLARSGVALGGAVSLHGLFTPSGLPARPIQAKVLALHGHDDPMVPPEAVLALQKELSEAGCDWQVHTYGDTVHAFTNPAANDPARGTVYSARADRRSWQALRNFLQEVLDERG